MLTSSHESKLALPRLDGQGVNAWGIAFLLFELVGMTRTHRLNLDGGISAQGFREFYASAGERLNQPVAGLPKLQAEVDFLRVNNLSADALLSEAQGLSDRWPKRPTGDKRKNAESIIEKIAIGDGEIDINFSCLPSS